MIEGFLIFMFLVVPLTWDSENGFHESKPFGSEYNKTVNESHDVLDVIEFEQSVIVE